MESVVKYELPVFSSALEKAPTFIYKGMNIKMEIEGYDEEDNLKKVTLVFSAVLCFKKTSARFTPELYGAYDKVVELCDSEWLRELAEINSEDFNYWNPKHYVLYLDSVGMFQFIAQEFEVVIAPPTNS